MVISPLDTANCYDNVHTIMTQAISTYSHEESYPGMGLTKEKITLL